MMILVTGARGVVGQPLCARLANTKVPFVAVSRQHQGLSAQGSVWLRWDLECQLDAAQQAALVGLRCLLHCAPLWTLPTETIRDLAGLGLQRVVVFSSTSIDGKRDTRNPQEARVVALLTEAEARLKSICEQLELSLTILRPSLIYGFGLDQNVTKIAQTIQRFGVMVLAGKGTGLRQPVHADDLVTAALAVIDRPATFGKTYNVVGGETLTYRAMVERIFSILGRPARIIALPLWALRWGLTLAAYVSRFAYTADMADRMNKDLVYDQRAAVADFAYTPRTFDPRLGVDIMEQSHE